MRVWAITGSIASGKSAVSRLFAAHGARIADADIDARAVLEPGSPTFEAVLTAFPETRTAGGDLNRQALAARIFADPQARAHLNSLMHPAIRQRMRAIIDSARSAPESGLLLYEVPLLYEGGLETWFDGVLVAHTSPEIQRQRLQQREIDAGRPPLSQDALNQRLASQLPPDEKARRADLVIDTGGTLENTARQVDAAWNQITAG